MRTIATRDQTMLESGGLTIATLWKITRSDGQVFGFTDHNEDITFGGLTYDANTSYDRTATADNAGFAVSNMEIQSIMDSDLIVEADIIAGLWDYAQVEMRYVNWYDRRVLHISAVSKASPGVVTTHEVHGLSTGDTVTISGVGGMTELNGNTYTVTVISTTTFSIGVNTGPYTTYAAQGEVRLTESSWGYRKGRIGQVNTSGQTFSSELMGIAKKLEKPLVRPYLPSCYAALGDSECGVNLAGYTITGTLESVDTSGLVLTDTANITAAVNAYAYGLITMTSGESSGYSMDVKSSTVGTLTLQQRLPFGVAAGDTYTLVQGCDKSLATCKNTYNNVINFRGFPHMPGMDQVLRRA
jgi:hypothetical protein